MKRIFLSAAVALALGPMAYGQNDPSDVRQEARDEARELRQDAREQSRDLRQQGREGAQQLRESQRVDRQANRPVSGENQGINGHIADCLILMNQEEIEIAQFAAQQAQNPEVKEFAQKLVQEHQQLGEKLQQFAMNSQQQRGSASRAVQGAQRDVTATDARDARVGERGQRDADQQQSGRIDYRAGYAGGQAEGVGQQMYQIAKEAHEQCTQMTKQALQEEQGEKFDQAFLGQQCGAHIAMLAMLKATSDHATGELQQTIQDAQSTVKEHKEQAKQLLKQVAASDEQGSRTR